MTEECHSRSKRVGVEKVSELDRKLHREKSVQAGNEGTGKVTKPHLKWLLTW